MLQAYINNTIDEWISVLERYSFETLIQKPDVENWSLGQVTAHIINESAFYMQQVEACLNSNENSSCQMTEEASVMFDQNSFPDIKIKRDVSLSQYYQQPENKPEILAKMQQLKARLNHLVTKIETSAYRGKTRHPGLGYFNALQWMQFTEMHMRHHLRQKKRIEALLKLK